MDESRANRCVWKSDASLAEPCAVGDVMLPNDAKGGEKADDAKVPALMLERALRALLLTVP
jgi:hypothetical protein